MMKCFVDFDGFKIGNDFDVDVLARAMGVKSGDLVASTCFESDGYKVDFEFFSKGEQNITILTDDILARDIALKYMSEEEKEDTAPEEFLESFQYSFNHSELTNESSLFLYKELRENELLHFEDNSWFEGHVCIKDSNGRILVDDWECNLGGDGVYGSIEEIELLLNGDIKKEILEYL